MARKIAQVESPSAGFNRYALVNVPPGTSDLRGWTLLTAGVSIIEAVSIASGKTSKVYEAQMPEEISANRSEADATSFKGVAANSQICAFLVMSARDGLTLTIKYLSQDRPVEKPVTIEGSKVIGPVLCGSSILFSSEEQIAMYDWESRRSAVMNLPDGFSPLLSPSSDDLTVAPGAIPLGLMSSGPSGAVAVLPGIMQGRTGLLQVQFKDGETEFRPLTKGCSLSSGLDGSVCLRTQNGVEVFSAGQSRSIPARTEPGMPTFGIAPYLVSFGQVDYAGQHRVNLTQGAQSAELPFEDSLCNRNSCCGAYMLGEDVLVAYLNVFAPPDEDGLRFARWTLAG